jgi:hypothetical protein
MSFEEGQDFLAELHRVRFKDNVAGLIGNGSTVGTTHKPRSPPRRVLIKGISWVYYNHTYHNQYLAMNAEQIKDEIRKLNRIDKIEIFRWIDVQAHAAHLLSGIGVYRLHAVRQGVDQKCRVIS